MYVVIEYAETPQATALLEKIAVLSKEVAYYQEKHEQVENQCTYLRGKIEEIETDYQETHEQLTRECTYLRGKIEELGTEQTWRKNLDRVQSEVMTPSIKTTLNSLRRYMQQHPNVRNADGYYQVDTAKLAEYGGQKVGTIRRNINEFSTIHQNGKPDQPARIPLFDKRLVSLENNHEVSYLKPFEAINSPQVYHEICTEINEWGGAGRGQGRKKSCEKCGGDLKEKSTVITKQQHTFCPRCEIMHVYPIEQVNSSMLPTDDFLPNDGGNGGNQLDCELEQSENQVDFVEEMVGCNQLDAVITEDIPYQVDCAKSEDEIAENQLDCESKDECPVTPPPRPSIGEYPPNGFSLEDWLARRRGHGPIIYSTGILDQSRKYLHKPAGYAPNIAAYIRGDLQHLYGSRPALDDGTTYLFGGDCDTPELDAQHLDWMTQLASAGIASIYWLRRPGRGHLEVYTDKAVDRKAFYAHLINVCPGLAAIPECFPIGKDQNTGGDDRADFPYSWPLYYRVGNQVVECAAEVRLPDHDFTMYSPGIQSDRNRLTWLISRAIVPAALIPALPLIKEATRSEPTRGGALLDTRRIDRLISLFDDGLGKAVIATFNDGTRWEDFTEVENGWFRAIWRPGANGQMGERTPSVKINDDGTAHDFGHTGHYPNHFDKFEAYCLINGLNKSDELKRRIAAYQEREQVAS